MFDLLIDCCQKVDLKEIDEVKKIEETEFFQQIINNLHDIEPIFNQGKNKDHTEFTRTIRHIFRAFKIYLLLIEDKFTHETLSKESETKIAEKTRKVDNVNRNLLPIILLYHDLGRFIRKSDHPEQSYKLIVEQDLLKSYKLNNEYLILIQKIIQHHLLFATIYTGESTFYGTYSLLNDKEFILLISDKECRDLFVDLLEVFTFIDILGYPYSQIYDHYVKYYDEINLRLKGIFELGKHIDKALARAFEYSLDWTNWRLAGALRIFQFVETESELTTMLFYEKLEESISNSKYPLLDKLTLASTIEKYLKPISKVQLKYALGFLMILAFGRFSRSKLDVKAQISDKLIIFWTLLAREMEKRMSESNPFLWNVFIFGIKNWFGLTPQQVSRISESSLENTIQAAKLEFQQEKKEYNLYLDFNDLNL